MSTSARLSFLKLILTAILLLANDAHAQSYKILHFFTGLEDGALPTDSPTLDAAGNLYGTSSGYFGCGSVFKVSPQPDGTWIETLLSSFCGAEGSIPGNVIFGKDGNLYGTTPGGGAFGAGTVFKLSPIRMVPGFGPHCTTLPTRLTMARFPSLGLSSMRPAIFMEQPAGEGLVAMAPSTN